jgi:hypothetical protein
VHENLVHHGICRGRCVADGRSRHSLLDNSAHPIHIHTTVGEPDGIKLNPEASQPTPSDLQYFAILTAPESMRIDDSAKVEAAGLLAAGPDAIASLHQAATDAESAIGLDTGLGPWTTALA